MSALYFSVNYKARNVSGSHATHPIYFTFYNSKKQSFAPLRSTPAKNKTAQPIRGGAVLFELSRIVLLTYYSNSITRLKQSHPKVFLYLLFAPIGTYSVLYLSILLNVLRSISKRLSAGMCEIIVFSLLQFSNAA